MNYSKTLDGCVISIGVNMSSTFSERLQVVDGSVDVHETYVMFLGEIWWKYAFSDL
jgi:hypothetical protein